MACMLDSLLRPPAMKTYVKRLVSIVFILSLSLSLSLAATGDSVAMG